MAVHWIVELLNTYYLLLHRPRVSFICMLFCVHVHVFVQVLCAVACVLSPLSASNTDKAATDAGTVTDMAACGKT